MTMFVRRPLISAGVFLMALFIGSASFSADSDNTKLPLIRSVKDAVVRVNGKAITEENLRIAVNNVMPMKSFHTTVSDRRFHEIRKNTLERLINDELIFEKAVSKKEADITAKEFAESLKQLKKRLRPGDTIEDVLKRSKMTMDGLKKELAFSTVVARVRRNTEKKFQKKSEALVTEKYMHKYYDTHLDKFKEPAQVHLLGILIKVDPSASQRQWIKTKKKIKNISDQALKGADFSALAKKYSQAPSAAKGGDMGWAHEGSLLPDIESVVSAMSVGDISKPVMSIYGFHVFKLVGKRPARQKKFKELNLKRLKSELVDKEYNIRWNAWIKGLRKGAKVEYLKRI
jgi:parvulin-like peptidyl-prolyl isomerase